MKFHRPRGLMVLKMATIFWAALYGASSVVHFCALESAQASSVLSVQTHVQQEFYEPLIPLSKNFKTCFKTDAKGSQVMSICTEGAATTSTEPTLTPQRVPAAIQKSQTPQRLLPFKPSGRSPPSK